MPQRLENGTIFFDTNELSCSDVIGDISEYYCLDYTMSDRITELTYCLFIRRGRKTKYVKLEYEEIISNIYYWNNSNIILP